MYTDYYGIDEYPFFATFYHLGVDDSKPLDQQVEEKIVSLKTKCDISDKSHSLNNDAITVYVPFNAEKDAISIQIGETVEISSYGLTQKGRVLGVYPSQLGGVTVLCTRI